MIYMNNSTVSDINNTTVFSHIITTTVSNINNDNNNNKIFKQIGQLGNKHLVIIYESIILKLGITENSITCVEQEMTSDNINLMKIKKF
jgi:hypothetical protein